MFLDAAAAKDTSVVQRGWRARSRAGGSERIPRGSVQLTRRQPARRPLAITGHGDRRGTYCRIQVTHHQNVTESSPPRIRKTRRFRTLVRNKW